MPETPYPVRMDQPATYRIKLQGRLHAAWSEWLGGMSIAVDKNANGQSITTLIGVVADHAALYGLLSRIRDLGLPLLLVECIAQEKEKTSVDSNSHEP